MGGPVLKNWSPKNVKRFLLKNGFEQIKTGKRGAGDHCCLYNRKTGAYTEIDMGRNSFL